MSHGFSNIVAVDLSQDMLDRAREKQCYAELLCADLCDSNALPEAGTRTCYPIVLSDWRLAHQIQAQNHAGWCSGFDALVCVGTLTFNHIEDGAVLRSWLRWVKPRSLACLTVRQDLWDRDADKEDGIKQTCERLAAEGVWELVEETPQELYTPKVSTDIFFSTRTYRTLP